MNKEEPYREQAERLKQRIQKINETIDSNDQLPPREQLHRQKKNKFNWKLKYPVIRLLVLSFILLPLIIFSVISYLDGKTLPGTKKTSGDSVGYETINLEKSKPEKPNQAPREVETEPVESSQETDQSEVPETSGTQIETGEAQAQMAEPTPPEPAQQVQTGETSSNLTDKNAPVPTQTAAPAKSEPAPKIVYHKVQAGETLYRIAIKYYHSKTGMDTIRKANHLTGDQINLGQVLKIPL
ncbi:LysM peptidoglycan-binding domain-containing protein [Neobacillus dielmonensis]|uniref:LysM peptidoglycan-binding domain-containing protein n=1 Tax=Neobacillus dielmonensis TaxID=1347369 RepID=UPI0005AB4B53|nr:LysM peptidoglycan-binding domain-containing protein [Neobacillus dielmonensis]